MMRRAIAIFALALVFVKPVAGQTAPVIDGQTGAVTISPQTLEWFRQRLADEEERLRQLQVTVQQMQRAIAGTTAALPGLTPAAPLAGAPRTGVGTQTPQDAPVAVILPSPGVGNATPPVATAPLTLGQSPAGAPATRREPRIAVPTFAPAGARNAGISAATDDTVSTGSPVKVPLGADDAAPGAATQRARASVTTEPSLLPLAAPLRGGMSLVEVRRIKGTPALISRDQEAASETWSYPDGQLTFRGGRLNSWRVGGAEVPLMEPVTRRVAPKPPAGRSLAASRPTTPSAPAAKTQALSSTRSARGAGKPGAWGTPPPNSASTTTGSGTVPPIRVARAAPAREAAPVAAEGTGATGTESLPASAGASAATALETLPATRVATAMPRERVSAFRARSEKTRLHRQGTSRSDAKRRSGQRTVKRHPGKRYARHHRSYRSVRRHHARRYARARRSQRAALHHSRARHRLGMASSSNCTLCRLARQHLRSGNHGAQSRVAAWRTTARAGAVPPATEPVSIRQRR